MPPLWGSIPELQTAGWIHSATSFLLAPISCLSPASAIAHLIIDTLPGIGCCYLWYSQSSYWFSTLYQGGCKKAPTGSQCLLRRGLNLPFPYSNWSHNLAAPTGILFCVILTPHFHQFPSWSRTHHTIKGCTGQLHQAGHPHPSQEHSLQIVTTLQWVTKSWGDSVNGDQGWPW